MGQKRVGIIRLTGDFLAQIMRLPGHSIEHVRRDFETGDFDFVVSGDLMPEQLEGMALERTQVLWGESVCDSIMRTWRSAFVAPETNQGGNKET